MRTFDPGRGVVGQCEAAYGEGRGRRTFDVAVEDLVLVQVGNALKQLLHVALYLGARKDDRLALEEARQVVLHKGKDHVKGRQDAVLLAGGRLGVAGDVPEGHIEEGDDVWVGEALDELDLAQGRDGDALAVRHRGGGLCKGDFFESDRPAALQVSGLEDLAMGARDSKRQRPIAGASLGDGVHTQRCPRRPFGGPQSL